MSFSEKNSVRSAAFRLHPALLVLLVLVMLATSLARTTQQKESGSTPRSRPHRYTGGRSVPRWVPGTSARGLPHPPEQRSPS